MEQWQKSLAAGEKQLVEDRRDVHRYAETGWTEYRTAAKVAERLEQLGYVLTVGKDALRDEDRMGVPKAEVLAEQEARALQQGTPEKWLDRMRGGFTALWADMDCGEGPLVALRFDLDANDCVESTEEAHRPQAAGFASVQAGAMHACGHDGHVAVGLAVAAALAAQRSQLRGKIRLIFQPAEEGVRGAKAMVSAGAVKNVDYLLGAHIGFKATRTGQVICGTDNFLATTKMDVTYSGVSSHAGAFPEQGKNALLAACSAALNLHAISRHGGGATRITVGTLHAGQGRNVIPPNAFFQLETRGATSELDEYMQGEARRIIEAAAAMWDVTYQIDVVGGTKGGESDTEVIAKVASAARSIPFFTEIETRVDFGASEDFAYLLSAVQEQGGKGCYTMFGAKLAAGHHNGRFDFDEAVLAPAAELLVRSALQLLESE